MESTQGRNTKKAYTIFYQGIDRRSKHGQYCGDEYNILGQGISRGPKHGQYCTKRINTGLKLYDVETGYESPVGE